MDLSEFLSVCEPHLSPPMLAKDLQDNNSIISLSQAEVSNINKKLLQVLSPSEDTIKTCLSSDQHEVTVNDNTDCDQSTILSNTMHLNIDRFYYILKPAVDLDQNLTTSTRTTRYQIAFSLMLLIKSC